MSDLPPPKRPGDKPEVSWQRKAIWLVVGGAGLYFIITGLVGILTKGG